MAKRQHWELPQLNYKGELGEHRKVTWLELFFDLFFVVSIAQLAHQLIKHPTCIGLLTFAGLFLPVWWIWIGFTYYNERFESNGLENRLFTFLLMLPVIGFAVFSHHGLEVGFVLSYATARLLLTVLWLRAAYHVSIFRATGIRFAIGFTLSILLSLVAAVVDTPMRYWIFGAALIIDVLTPLATARHQVKLPRFSSSKLPERFGLFVIIVLGEMVVGVVNGLAKTEHLTVPLFLESVLGVSLGFGLWWVYFDFIARRPPKVGVGWGFAWAYLHLPLVMGIAATGAGVSIVISHEGLLTPEVRQLIAGSVGIILVAMALLEITLFREDDEPSHKYFSPALKIFASLLAFTIGWSEGITDSLFLLLALLGLVLGQMIYGGWVWFRQEI